MNDEIPALLIPVSEVTLWQACRVHPELRGDYEQAMAPVLATYGSVSTESYWHLTVSEWTALTAPLDLPATPNEALERIRAELREE